MSEITANNLNPVDGSIITLTSVTLAGLNDNQVEALLYSPRVQVERLIRMNYLPQKVMALYPKGNGVMTDDVWNAIYFNTLYRNSAAVSAKQRIQAHTKDLSVEQLGLLRRSNRQQTIKLINAKDAVLPKSVMGLYPGEIDECFPNGKGEMHNLLWEALSTSLNERILGNLRKTPLS